MADRGRGRGRGGGPRKPPFQEKPVWLARPEVFKTSTGEHAIRAVARVNRKGDQPLPTGLCFVLNGTAYGPYAVDSQTGACQQDFTVKPGAHVLWAQIPGTNLRSQEFSFSVLLPEKKKEEPRKAERIAAEVRVMGPGEFRIVYRVLTKDGEGIAKVVLQTPDSTKPRGFRKLKPTDKSGNTIDIVTLLPGERDRQFTVMGPGVERIMRIYR